MKFNWMLLILVFSCSTKQQENSKVKSKPSNDLVMTVESETKLKTVYDSLATGGCNYSNLSKEFQIQTTFKRYTNKETHQDSCVVKLYLNDKITHQVIDSIQVTSGFLFEDVFMKCENVMSYSTKFNSDMEVVDNYYGDIVIADLNFDNKEDIAVTNDSGGNGGTFYSYFIQADDNTFVLDKFLTDTMTYFPAKMNSDKRTLVTYVHAGICGIGEHVYQLDKKINQWKSKSHRVINMCNK